MNEYTVTVEVGYGGQAFEIEEVVDAYSESEAKDAASEKVRNNLLVNANQAETEEDENGDNSISFTVFVSVEGGGYSLDTTEEVDAYTNSEALNDAESKVQNNLSVLSTDVELID